MLGEEPSGLPHGRVPLYVCECGHVGCGTIAAAVDHLDDAVVWHSLGWHDGYDPVVEYEPYRGLGPFRFHKAAYETLLRGFLADHADRLISPNGAYHN